MDVRFIAPFYESTLNVFEKVLGASASSGKPRSSAEPVEEVLIATIGLSGGIQGTVALKLPVETALNFSGRVQLHPKREVDPDVCDMLAELTNMIVGGAKVQLSRLEEVGSAIALGLPAVHHGHHSESDLTIAEEWFSMPFESDLGPFELRVLLVDPSAP